MGGLHQPPPPPTRAPLTEAPLPQGQGGCTHISKAVPVLVRVLLGNGAQPLVIVQEIAVGARAAGQRFHVRLSAWRKHHAAAAAVSAAIAGICGQGARGR